MTQCRFCEKALSHEFIDLVSAPLSNAFIKKDDLTKPETYYPLKLFVCSSCLLTQVEEHKAAHEIFDADYVYFSSFSKTWLDHCKRYVEHVVPRFHLNTQSRVYEVASNDGYLLQYFKEKNIPTVGIEPTQSTADVAIKKGIDTVVRFFGVACAKDMVEQKGKADLIAANNVLAHVPNLNDFVGGFKILLAEKGVATFEFPHLMRLVKDKLFDTIYHEHFSYFSLLTICKIFSHHGLRVFDVEEIQTQGGSLRIYVDHGSHHKMSPAVDRLLAAEKAEGMESLSYYNRFQEIADALKNEFLAFLLEAKKKGKVVVGYGAAAKGNTLVNYCGIKKDLIRFVVDASPHKQGRYLPGSHIPVVAEAVIKETQPDYVLILPWNLKDEIANQLSYIRQWDAQFLVAFPQLRIF